jgi:hypothetical protein
MVNAHGLPNIQEATKGRYDDGVFTNKKWQ